MIKTWLVGRGPGCGVVVDDPYASEMHCQVTRAVGLCYVRDLGSTNGTWIRRGMVDLPVRSWTSWEPGDLLIVGRTPLDWSSFPV